MSLDISLNTGVQNTFHRSRGPSHRSQSESVIPVAQKFLFSQQQNVIASFLLLSTSLSLLFDKIVGEKPRCFLRKILTELDPCPRIEQRNRRTRRFHASRRYSPILTIISFTKGRKKEEIGGLVAWKSCVQSPWIRCSLRVARWPPSSRETFRIAGPGGRVVIAWLSTRVMARRGRVEGGGAVARSGRRFSSLKIHGDSIPFIFYDPRSIRSNWIRENSLLFVGGRENVGLVTHCRAGTKSPFLL